MAYSVAGAGDVDGDGYGDLAFGPVSAGVGAETAARLVFGPVAGVRALDDGDLTLALSTDTWVTVQGTGDPDEDGLLDLLVGAPGVTNGDSEGAGTVYLLPTPTDGDVMVESVAAATVRGLHRGAYLGQDLSALGDSDGDGLPDPWVSGQDTEDPDSSEYTGAAAYLFQGPLSGAYTTADADAELFVADDFGSLAIDGHGDLNGDGYDDLIVGSCDIWGGSVVDGDVYVKLGPFAGVISSADADAVVVGLPDATSSSGSSWTDNLGCDVASPGDLDHDGTDEVLMTGQGLFDLYYSPISGTLDPELADVRIGYYTWSEEDLDDRVPGYYSGSYSVGVPGDVDGDGTPDLLLGSHAYDRDASWPRDNAARIFSGTPD